MIYIGIDLSTNLTGVNVINHNKKQLFWMEYDFQGFKELDRESYLNIRDFFTKLMNGIAEWEKNYHEKEFKVIIEVGNFSNAKLNQRFSKLAGIISWLFFEKFNHFMVTVKECNANEWFRHFNKDFVKESSWTKLSREQRKKLSVDHYNKVNYFQPTNSDNVADSYWIAYYFDKCFSTETSIKKHLELVRLNKKMKKSKKLETKQRIKMEIENLRGGVKNPI